MTRAEVLAMPAGREMDYAVHLVLGERLERPPFRVGGENEGRTNVTGWFTDQDAETFARWFPGAPRMLRVPRYSRGIEAAWRMVERLADAHDIAIHTEPSESGRVGWLVMIQPWYSAVTAEPVFAEDVPLAICRAALLCSVATPPYDVIQEVVRGTL